LGPVECSKEVEEIPVRGRKVEINVYTIKDGAVVLKVYAFVCGFCGRVLSTCSRDHIAAIVDSHLYYRHGVEG